MDSRLTKVDALRAFGLQLLVKDQNAVEPDKVFVSSPATNPKPEASRRPQPSRFASFAAQRFFSAATIAARPSVLSFRLPFAAAGFAEGESPDWTFDALHLFRCASPIRFRAAADIFLLVFVIGSGAAGASSASPDIIARSSAIWPSIRSFCRSKPCIAALRMSVLDFGEAM